MTSPSKRKKPATSADGRERILRAAYDLFRHQGVRAVGVERIIAEAGVAKMTLYKHFRSKDELVLAVLELREQLWTRDWLELECERRAATPRERLLAIFDAFDSWFREGDYEGCLFANTLLESRGATSLIGAASVRGLADVRSFVAELAAEAGVRDPDSFAHQWQMLMCGSIVLAVGGDLDSARRARDVAQLLIEREAPTLTDDSRP